MADKEILWGFRLRPLAGSPAISYVYMLMYCGDFIQEVRNQKWH